MEILIILIVILVVFYFCYLNSKNNKLTKTEAFDSPPPPPPVNQQRPSEPHITMYEHIGYTGSAFNCPIGFTSDVTLWNNNWNDKTSSIRIPQGLRAVFYEDADRGGKQLPLGAGNYPTLIDMGWNDRISSVDVFRV
jgi:hypothetical protein